MGHSEVFDWRGPQFEPTPSLCGFLSAQGRANQGERSHKGIWFGSKIQSEGFLDTPDMEGLAQSVFLGAMGGSVLFA